MTKVWTDEELARHVGVGWPLDALRDLIRHWDAGRFPVAIGILMKRSRCAVRGKAHRLGLPNLGRPREPWSDAEEAILRRMMAAHATNAAIAAQIPDRSEDAVRRRRKGMLLNAPPPAAVVAVDPKWSRAGDGTLPPDPAHLPPLPSMVAAGAMMPRCLAFLLSYGDSD